MTGAFKSQADAIKIPPQWWPEAPTLENFQKLLVQNPAGSWMMNSILIALITMLLVCVTSALAGYVLAKKRFYGQALLFSVFIGAMALPKQVILVPLVRIISFMGIHDTRCGSNSSSDRMAVWSIPYEAVQRKYSYRIAGICEN